MDILNLKYKKALMMTKTRLQKELKMVEEEIKTQQDSCNHLNVSIGLLDSRTGDYEHTYECLFCGTNNLDDSYTPMIVVSSYLQGDQRVWFSLQTRKNIILDSLRALALQYIDSHPSCSMEELIMVLKEEINKDYEKGIHKKKSKNNIKENWYDRKIRSN